MKNKSTRRVTIVGSIRIFPDLKEVTMPSILSEMEMGMKTNCKTTRVIMMIMIFLFIIKEYIDSS